jgi:hypothetical protein
VARIAGPQVRGLGAAPESGAAHRDRAGRGGVRHAPDAGAARNGDGRRPDPARPGACIASVALKVVRTPRGGAGGTSTRSPCPKARGAVAHARLNPAAARLARMGNAIGCFSQAVSPWLSVKTARTDNTSEHDVRRRRRGERSRALYPAAARARGRRAQRREGSRLRGRAGAAAAAAAWGTAGARMRAACAAPAPPPHKPLPPLAGGPRPRRPPARPAPLRGAPRRPLRG